MREIKQNTSLLQAEINKLDGYARQLETESNTLFQALTQLNGMWEGAAHDTFVNKFTSDRETWKSMLVDLQKMIEKMRTAKQEYDKCESRVINYVRQLR